MKRGFWRAAAALIASGLLLAPPGARAWYKSPLGWSDLPPLAIAGPGYVAGNWYMPLWQHFLSSGNTNTAGTIYCYPGALSSPVTIEALGSRVITAASGNVQFAIYANGSWGRPSAPLLSTGSITTATANVITATVTAASLQAGFYWFCAQTDNTTATFVSSNDGNYTAGAALVGSSNLASIMFYASMITGVSVSGTYVSGSWPTFTSSTSWNDITIGNYGAAVAFQVKSSP